MFQFLSSTSLHQCLDKTLSYEIKVTNDELLHIPDIIWPYYQPELACITDSTHHTRKRLASPFEGLYILHKLALDDRIFSGYFVRKLHTRVATAITLRY